MFVRLNTQYRHVVNTSEIVQVKEQSIPDALGKRWLVMNTNGAIWLSDEEIAPLLAVLDAEEKHTAQFVEMFAHPLRYATKLLHLDTVPGAYADAKKALDAEDTPAPRIDPK